MSMTSRRVLYATSPFAIIPLLTFLEIDKAQSLATRIIHTVVFGSATFFSLGCVMTFVWSATVRIPEHIASKRPFSRLRKVFERYHLSPFARSPSNKGQITPITEKSRTFSAKRLTFILALTSVGIVFISWDISVLLNAPDHTTQFDHEGRKVRALAFGLGCALTLLGSFLFNFRDYVKYGWPLSQLLRWASKTRQLLVTRLHEFCSTKVDPNVENAESHTLEPVKDSTEHPTSLTGEVHTKKNTTVDTHIEYPRWPPAEGAAIGHLPPYAVIIPCHNYGAFLSEALDSVVSQVPAPAEVVVILDDCSDNSAAVAASYADRGVRSLVVHCRDAFLSRRAGFNATSAPFVCALDADDKVGRGYFAAGLPCFRDPRVGIVTGWVQEFGNFADRWKPFPSDLTKENCVSSCSIFRRSAAEGTQLFERIDGAGVFYDDYFGWKILAEAGWSAALSTGVHHYRLHEKNKSLSSEIETSFVKRLRSASGKAQRKLRVVFVTPALNHIGGGETHFAQLLKYAKELEWVGVAQLRGDLGAEHKSERYQGIPLIREKTHAMTLKKLASLCDVLYAWGQPVAQEMAKLRLDIPICAGIHGEGRDAEMAAKHFAEMGAFLIADSAAAAEVVPSGVPCQVIPQGADLPTLSVGASRWQQRDAWGIDPYQVAVGHVGLWSTTKDRNLFLEAMRYLPERVRPVVWTSLDSISTEERIFSEKLAGRPIVWNTSFNQGAVYRGLDAVVALSNPEGDTSVMLEAWACECPTISTLFGAIPELQAQFGEMTYPLQSDPTPEEIAKAIVSTLDDPGLTLGRRLRAKNAVWQHLTSFRVVRNWERGISQLARTYTSKLQRGDKSTRPLERMCQ